MHRTAIDPAELTAACRDAGLRATPQRLAVLRVPWQTGAHPSPESIYNAVRAEIPTISRATVYSALESLRTAGVIKEVAVLADTKRYDGNATPHQHLVCTRCQRIVDTTDAALEIAVPDIPGFFATEVRVQVLGLCTECAVAAKAGVENSAVSSSAHSSSTKKLGAGHIVTTKEN